MTIIARKYLHLPTPNGDTREVTLEVANSSRGYLVLRDGHELSGVGPYRTKQAALVACSLGDGEGLAADVTIARERTPMTNVRVIMRDGACVVFDGDIVVATFDSQDDALESVGLTLGQGLAPSMSKTFACHI
ncbi:MAG: hypothetical protein V3W41_12815 [Planctomycetota bacterium]